MAHTPEHTVTPNEAMQDTVEDLAMDLHEFRGINFNPGDVARLVKQLREAASDLENLDETLTLERDQANRCPVCDRDEPGLSHTSCNRAVELGVD
jgi:hypothetical protein